MEGLPPGDRAGRASFPCVESSWTGAKSPDVLEIKTNRWSTSMRPLRFFFTPRRARDEPNRRESTGIDRSRACQCGAKLQAATSHRRANRVRSATRCNSIPVDSCRFLSTVPVDSALERLGSPHDCTNRLTLIRPGRRDRPFGPAQTLLPPAIPHAGLRCETLRGVIPPARL